MIDSLECMWNVIVLLYIAVETIMFYHTLLLQADTYHNAKDHKYVAQALKLLVAGSVLWIFFWLLYTGNCLVS